jgi:hypothetical protein
MALALTPLLISACRDPLRPGAVAPVPIPDTGYLLQTVVEAAAGSDRSIVRLRWSGGATAALLGGFQATLRLPAGVSVIGDVSAQTQADGEMARVVRDDAGTIIAVGAAVRGLALGDLFVVEVAGAAARVAQLRVELTQAVDLRGADLRARVRQAPVRSSR